MSSYPLALPVSELATGIYHYKTRLKAIGYLLLWHLERYKDLIIWILHLNQLSSRLKPCPGRTD